MKQGTPSVLVAFTGPLLSLSGVYVFRCIRLSAVCLPICLSVLYLL